MELLMVGVGYVGLVTGACLAEMGHHVTCLDIDTKKIEALNQGEIPIFEPGLEELVKRNAAAGRLFFTTDYKEAVEKASVCFIAVPTPSKENGACDVTYVLQAASQIAEHIKSYKVVVIKSTVPVGTLTQVKDVIQTCLQKSGKTLSFDVVSNPEFLKEGSAVSDCLKPDRILLGVENSESARLMKELYSAFTVNHDRILVMDAKSAEMSKYAANAMLATRISFMNELSGLCEKVGANINDVRIAIGSDSRIGYQFLYAGVGYGGSCFPKDLRAFQAMAKETGYSTPIIDAVELINDRQKQLLSKKIESYFRLKGGLAGKTIAIWGLSFKPDTDDIREAPALELIREMLAQGASLRLYDPISIANTQKHLGPHPQLHLCKDEYEAATGAHAIALVTEWRQFRFVDFAEIQKKMENSALFDGRNQYKKHEMKEKGFDYFGVGVPS